MALVHRPYVFLVVAALGGVGWTISASELWVASQRAMPDCGSGGTLLEQHLLQRERMTKDEQKVLLKLRSLQTDPNPPQEWISLSLEKEILNKRVRTGGLPPGYIDQ
jgi:hypothetical protein